MKIRKINKEERERIKQRMIHEIVNENHVLVYSFNIDVFARYLKEHFFVDPESYDKPYIFLSVPDRIAYFKHYWEKNPGNAMLATISPELAWGLEVTDDDLGENVARAKSCLLGQNVVSARAKCCPNNRIHVPGLFKTPVIFPA